MLVKDNYQMIKLDEQKGLEVFLQRTGNSIIKGTLFTVLRNSVALSQPQRCWTLNRGFWDFQQFFTYFTPGELNLNKHIAYTKK